MAKGKVVFREDRCKGCELCVSVCPSKIIHLHETRINSSGYHPAWVTEIDMERCIGCANCGIICPDGVISVYREESKKGE